jgi:hypothetical protein
MMHARWFASLLVVAATCVSALGAQRTQPPVVTGRVADDTGRPLEGVVVLADDGGRALTDLEGRFALAPRACGVLRLTVRRPGAVGVTLTTDPCDGAATPIEIVLRPLAQRLDAVQVQARVTGVIGVVTDRTGEPMPGVEVVLLGARAPTTTDSAGRFTLLDVPPGAYLLRARDRRHEAQQLSVALGDGDVRDVTILMWPLPENASASSRDELAGYGVDAWWYTDLSRRRAWRGAYSAIVSREELLAAGERDLSCALASVPKVPRVFNRLTRGTCADWTPALGCVIVDGRWDYPQPLWSIRARDVELVELYAPRGDFTASTVARARSCPSGQPVAVVWSH